MDKSINTVMGTVSPDHLGRTLMHEHVFVEYGTALNDMRSLGSARGEIVSACIRTVEEIQQYGVETVVDATTTDLGRHVPLMVEVAEKTGINIICATGIYGTAAYRMICDHLGDGPDAVAGLFIKELTEGIGDSGVKAGIIKVVTGHAISRDEQALLLAAARASVETGAPIITHTEGVLGEEQQRILGGAGVPPHRMIVGHSCISTNFDYHMSIVRGGSYLGFDRFGMETGMADETRAVSLVKLVQAGGASHLVVSHDSVWYWVGGLGIGSGPYKNWTPTNFFERMIPMLRYSGVTDKQIDTLLCENPRRFFADEPPEAVGKRPEPSNNHE